MTKPDKRDEIVRAALELIAEYGFHGAPMAMIADRAGVGAGTIYRYFENKDVLITELYREVEEKLYAVLLEGYATEKPFRERFLHLGTALLRYFIQNPLHFRYLEQFHNSPYGVAFRRDKILGKKGECDVFRELFEDGISQQVMKDLPLPVLFALAFGPLLTVARDHILSFISLDDALIARIVDACWDGIRR
ncbi:TetR/AcrR family transcriptional regulator [Geotalea uraniireducens]|uniref:Transcriptional regulator, TetR family n=1 Tax=Geotalea uraniireducens (strain Rf4) TaxID=351605 RepID=A5G787_GEOUR|nr:TetR/AcrR family transcriptional regulator [Geotalea uraniireducens]ABQ27655.1 transcriptional regulator, TetR family [Geotalea uraniireducens Rf4]